MACPYGHLHGGKDKCLNWLGKEKEQQLDSIHILQPARPIGRTCPRSHKFLDSINPFATARQHFLIEMPPEKAHGPKKPGVTAANIIRGGPMRITMPSITHMKALHMGKVHNTNPRKCLPI